MKNIIIALITGVIFVLLVTLLITIIQYILTVYVNVNKKSKGGVILRYGKLPLIIGVLIALEIYLILL